MNRWKKIKREKLGELPQEASKNLQAPEVAPEGKTKVKKERTRSLGIKVSESFFKKLSKLAWEEDRFLVDIIEQAVNEYEARKRDIKKTGNHEN